MLQTLQSSPKEYCRAINVRNVEDVFNAPDVTLISIKLDIGEMKLRAIVVLLIAEVVEFFNVGKTMNAQQVALTADLIIQYYSYFKLEDIKLCFRNAMIGKYGELYDRLDGAIILSWFKKYEMERIDKAIEISENEAKQVKASFDNFMPYQDYLSILKEKAENGDEEAQNSLNNHLGLQEKLKDSGFAQYSISRERKRLYGE